MRASVSDTRESEHPIQSTVSFGSWALVFESREGGGDGGEEVDGLLNWSRLAGTD